MESLTAPRFHASMTEHTHPTPMTLVLGSTGKTGRRVVERLAERGVPMRLGSRSADAAVRLGRPVDLGARAARRRHRLHLLLPRPRGPGRGGHGRRVRAPGRRPGRAEARAAAGRGEEEAERCEDAVRDAGADWTIVRSTWFSQNFSEAFMRDAVMAGVVALPVTDVREPFVDADDIADVAVAALTEPGHTGRTYELTGPRSLTFAEAIAEIAEASGRDVPLETIPLDAFTAELTAHGVAGRARAAHVPVHRGARRPQRAGRRRRPARARPRAARLPHVRARRRRGGRLERAVASLGCARPTSTATTRARSSACRTRPGRWSTCCTPTPHTRPGATSSRRAAASARRRSRSPRRSPGARFTSVDVVRRVARRGAPARRGGRADERRVPAGRHLRPAVRAGVVRPRVRLLRARAPRAAGRGAARCCAGCCGRAGRSP